MEFELLWSPRCTRCDFEFVDGRPTFDGGVSCCSHCRRRLPGTAVPETFVLCNVPRTGNMAFIGVGATVIERRIAEVMAAQAEDQVTLRAIPKTAGRKHRDWCIVFVRRELIVRRRKGAGFRLCPVCGAVLYSAMYSQHLSPKPDDRIAVYQIVGGGELIIRSDVADAVRPLIKGPTELMPLPVLVPSLDGLVVPHPPDGVLAWSW
jgi:hypothetical protein